MLRDVPVVGKPCGRRTIGLLQRRVVRETYVAHVCKEANELEEVEAGSEWDPDVIYTEYGGSRGDAWRLLISPVLKEIPARTLAKELNLSIRAVKSLRNGHTELHERNYRRLIDYLFRQGNVPGMRSESDFKARP